MHVSGGEGTDSIAQSGSFRPPSSTCTNRLGTISTSNMLVLPPSSSDSDHPRYHLESLRSRTFEQSLVDTLLSRAHHEQLRQPNLEVPAFGGNIGTRTNAGDISNVQLTSRIVVQRYVGLAVSGLLLCMEALCATSVHRSLGDLHSCNRHIWTANMPIATISKGTASRVDSCQRSYVSKSVSWRSLGPIALPTFALFLCNRYDLT